MGKIQNAHTIVYVLEPTTPNIKRVFGCRPILGDGPLHPSSFQEKKFS